MIMYIISKEAKNKPRYVKLEAKKNINVNMLVNRINNKSLSLFYYACLSKIISNAGKLTLSALWFSSIVNTNSSMALKP